MLSQYTTVAQTTSGSAHLSPDRKTLAVCFTTLADTRGAADLMRGARAAVAEHQVQVFVTDAQNAEAASFDAIWSVETCLSNLRHAGSIREWRHVPSGSPALHTALRRMVRQAQAQGLFCGVYASLDAALGAEGGCLIEGQSGMLNSPTGVVMGTGQYILAELTAEVPANMLDIHIDVLAYALQGSAAPRVILRLLPGVRLSGPSLLAGIRRILNIGSNPIVAIVDEAGILQHEALPDTGSGVCCACQSVDEAAALLPELGLDRFRTAPARAAAPVLCDCMLGGGPDQVCCSLR